MAGQPTTSPCQSCHAGCCRSFAVPITGADILRLERDLNLTFWDVACRWEDPQGRIARNFAPHFHFADEPQTPFVICLLHRPSEWFPETTKCRFLMEGEPSSGEPLGQARCGIYHSRPGTCRTFPATIHESGSLVVLDEKPTTGRDDLHDAYQLCPREWETIDFDSLAGLQELVVTRFEMTFFHQIAASWNQTPQPWELFPEFLRAVYSSRVVAKQAIEYDANLPETIPFPVEKIRSPKSRAA